MTAAFRAESAQHLPFIPTAKATGWHVMLLYLNLPSWVQPASQITVGIAPTKLYTLTVRTCTHVTLPPPGPASMAAPWVAFCPCLFLAYIKDLYYAPTCAKSSHITNLCIWWSIWLWNYRIKSLSPVALYCLIISSQVPLMDISPGSHLLQLVFHVTSQLNSLLSEPCDLEQPATLTLLSSSALFPLPKGREHRHHNSKLTGVKVCTPYA